MEKALPSFLKAPWKAYCISLPRCTDRRERFTRWATEISLPFTWWDAVDKQTLPQATVLSGNQLSLGATACRLSHEALWKHCLEEDKDMQFFFLFEDDAGFKTKESSQLLTFLNQIQQGSPRWDILTFGFGTMTGSDLHLLSKRYPPGVLQVTFCDQTHAILYTRRALEEMLSLSKDPRYQTRPSDGLLLTYVLKKKGIVLAPKTSLIEQTDTVSFISG